MNGIISFILVLVLLWFFLIFVLSRLVVPFLRFRRFPIPAKMPKEMGKTIERLKKKSKSKEDFLKKSYDFLTKKYHGGRLNTIFKPKYHFITDINRIWDMKGYIPCSTHNYLLRVFLIKSGLFGEREIKIRYTFVNMNIHQYLKVKVDGRWIDVDVAGDYFGVPFGKHTTLFK